MQSIQSYFGDFFSKTYQFLHENLDYENSNGTIQSNQIKALEKSINVVPNSGRKFINHFKNLPPEILGKIINFTDSSKHGLRYRLVDRQWNLTICELHPVVLQTKCAKKLYAAGLPKPSEAEPKNYDDEWCEWRERVTYSPHTFNVVKLSPLLNFLDPDAQRNFVRYSCRYSQEKDSENYDVSHEENFKNFCIICKNIQEYKYDGIIRIHNEPLRQLQISAAYLMFVFPCQKEKLLFELEKIDPSSTYIVNELHSEINNLQEFITIYS